MARARTNALAPRAEVIEDDWRDHRRVVKLTAEILRLHERLARQVVEGVRAIGEHMAEIRRVITGGFTTGGRRRMPIDKALQGIEHPFAGLDALIDRKDEVEPATAAEPHEQLVELAAELEERCGL